MTDLRTWLADMLVPLRRSASRRELMRLTGEHRIEARRSIITLRDGIVIGCVDRADADAASTQGLLGMTLVGWVTRENGVRVVSTQWRPNARALLWSNSRSAVGVTSPSFAFVPAAGTSSAHRDKAPSIVPLAPGSMTRVDLATAV
jgi:hypothetical protein